MHRRNIRKVAIQIEKQLPATQILWQQTHTQTSYGKGEKTISGDSIIGGISKKGFNKQHHKKCLHSLDQRIIITKYIQSAANVVVLNVSINNFAGKDRQKCPQWKL